MTTSRRVKPVAAGAPPRPPVCAGLLILRGHPEALQRVGLGARAVLPGDVDLQVAERALRLEVELLVAQALVPPGMAHQDVGAEALGAVAVLAVVLDLRGGEHRVHGSARRQHGARLPARPSLHAQAPAEDLEAGDDPHPENRQRDRDLDEREANAGGGPPHPVASPTCTVPRSGSRATRRRCSVRSYRPARITSAPLVLPFGKKRTCTTPSPRAWPPRTSSMTARSVSTAQRPQAVVWMLFSRASMTSSCGWPSATASPRQSRIVD